MHMYVDIFIEKWIHVNVPVVGLVDGYMLGSGWLLTSLKFGTVWGWKQCPLHPRKAGHWPNCVPLGSQALAWLSPAFKVLSGAWGNWKCQCTMDGVIPGDHSTVQQGLSFSRLSEIGLPGWCWQADYGWFKLFIETEIGKKRKKKNLPRSQMLKGWPWLEIQIWK